mgnify:CR=1 FL=1
MNIYLNLKPNNYDGESDLLTVDLPANYIDDIMKYVRPIAEEKSSTESKVLKDIFKQSIFEISRRENERKNRKNKKR